MCAKETSCCEKMVFATYLHRVRAHWFLAFIIIEVTVAVYALSLDIREKKPLLLYTILHRLSFLYILEIIRMPSQLEETFHYPMKWEKMENHGTATI